VSAILARFQEDPAPLMLVARAVALAISLVALPAVYFTARRLWGAREAFLATAFLALSPLHLDLSRVARVDAPCAALTIVAMWLALRFVDSPSWSRFVSMGIAAGAAAAFKEYGGGIVIPIMLLIAASPIRRRGLVAVAHGALAVVAFAALSPFQFLEFDEYRPLLKHASNLYVTPYWGDGQSTLLGVSGTLARYAVGFVGAIGCAAYVIGIARRPRRARARETIAVLGYPVLLCGAFFAADTFFVRFFLPALPFLCLAAARGLVLLAKRAARAPRTVRTAAACALAAGGVWLVADFAGTARWIAAREDPRVRSANWIERNVPRDMPIVTGFRRNSPHILSVEEPMAHRVPTLRQILEAHAPEHVAPLDASVEKARERAAHKGWAVHYERDTLLREAAKPGNAKAALVITFEKTKEFRKTDRDRAIGRLQKTHALAAEFPGGWHGALGVPTQIWMPK
jgi:hypothetical protein